MMVVAVARDTKQTLSGLLRGLARVDAGLDRTVGGVSMDSRAAAPGDLFLATIGSREHGLAYAYEAVRRGVAAIAYEVPTELPLPEADIPLIPVPALGRQAGNIAARFHAYPSRGMQVIGVTGTNGKTSCTSLLAQVLAGTGTGCGLIGTLGYGRPGDLTDSGMTTPDPVRLQKILAGFRDNGITRVAMEVSSHSLAQRREAGVHFDAALFTNLTRDHLDYHRSAECYFRAKRRLFEHPHLKVAAINADDPAGRRLLEALPAGCTAVLYGTESRIDAPPGVARLEGRIETGDTGLVLHVDGSWGRARLEAPLLGRFNGLNLLGCLAVLLGLDVPLEEAARRLAAVRPVPGRMQVHGGDGRPLVVIDYAHSPDALEKALTACREHTRGRLICVFGCGGDRDRGKRAEMGRIAGGLADWMVLTDDNPRGEDPDVIVAGILEGVPDPERVTVQHDRRRAIAQAIGGARPEDLVLVAGKGVESCQVIGDRRVPFRDGDAVDRALGRYRR
ncbi:MAG TPA: UDP-N-acetylmuramoyl-L-alanyl-D-glutamate--2,6-diaminopimelate ligase [Gammaproteobacteria bacterium]|nr:UDP-N-acetylmuramoyl-L-alanyl-D-glutamate--2,6-diaminopimelate ligase [Gammaproteobacteria bacterium]